MSAALGPPAPRPFPVHTGILARTATGKPRQRGNALPTGWVLGGCTAMRGLPRLQRDSGSPRMAVACLAGPKPGFRPCRRVAWFGFTPSKCPPKRRAWQAAVRRNSRRACALRSHNHRKSEGRPRRAQRLRTHRWRCAFSLPHALSRGRFASQACRSGAAKQVGLACGQAIAVRLGTGCAYDQGGAVHGGIRRSHILIAGRAYWIRARGQLLSKP